MATISSSREIFERDNWTCLIPGCKLGPVRQDLVQPDPLSPSVDHIVPISRGGSKHHPANKRTAHLVCNIRRGNRMHPDDLQLVTPERAPFGLLQTSILDRPKRPLRLGPRRWKSEELDEYSWWFVGRLLPNLRWG